MSEYISCVHEIIFENLYINSYGGLKNVKDNCRCYIDDLFIGNIHNCEDYICAECEPFKIIEE